MELEKRTIHGVDVHSLRAGDTTVSSISDPAPVPWVCDALLVGATPARLREAEARLAPGLVDAEAGTITIAFNTFLIQTGRNTVLVDTGIGNDKARPDRPMWHHRAGRYLEILAALGVVPEAVDTVITTHFHADHTGWNTRWHGGQWVPAFPQARYLCAQAELDYWAARHADDRAQGRQTLFGSYEDSIAPLLQAGRLTGLPDDAEPLPGIRFAPAPGHSPGMIAVHVDTIEGPLHLWADIVHHPMQFMWNDITSVACTDAPLARQTRQAAIARAVADGAVVAGTHLASPVFSRIGVVAGEVVLEGV